MPTDGLLANGVSAGRLRWVAIAGLTILGTILIGSALGERWFGDPYKWSNQMVLRFYTVVFLLDIITLYILWVLIG